MDTVRTRCFAAFKILKELVQFSKGKIFFKEFDISLRLLFFTLQFLF